MQILGINVILGWSQKCSCLGKKSCYLSGEQMKSRTDFCYGRLFLIIHIIRLLQHVKVILQNTSFFPGMNIYAELFFFICNKTICVQFFHALLQCPKNIMKVSNVLNLAIIALSMYCKLIWNSVGNYIGFQ